MTVRGNAAKGKARARAPRTSSLGALCRFLSRPHLVRLVTLLTLLTASIGMTGSHVAMAMPAPPAIEHGAIEQGPMEQGGAAAMSHCADMQQDQHDKGRSDIDCMIACSGLPATLASRDAVFPMCAMRHSLPLARALDGLDIAAELPPPRRFDA